MSGTICKKIHTVSISYLPSEKIHAFLWDKTQSELEAILESSFYLQFTSAIRVFTRRGLHIWWVLVNPESIHISAFRLLKYLALFSRRVLRKACLLSLCHLQIQQISWSSYHGLFTPPFSLGSWPPKSSV